ncbi:MAG: hypothetical protein KC550_02505 [Nanoarchaeota archaeon]|nr:hypothetical protein [Nanoarchaeota archaeon]
MRNKLAFLMNLNRLKKIYQGEKGIDISELESEFLSFSKHAENFSLKVKLPKFYIPHESEIKHLEEAISIFGLDKKILNGVDISGGFDYNQLRQLLFLSLGQHKADYSTTLRSYLNPLVEKIYDEVALMISEFSIHEVLTGKVMVKRGSVDLDKIDVFPERFRNGSYMLSVDLDTPNSSVKRFKDLSDLLDEVKKNPQKMLSNPKILESVKDAISLRERLGSLSRYSNPENQTISVHTNTYVSRNNEHTYFYLYDEKSNTNALVYFGEKPFEQGRFPSKLKVLEGEEYQHSLSKLVEMGFYGPSEAVLENRLDKLSRIYDNAKSHGNNMDVSHVVLSKTLGKLREAKDYFGRVLNVEMRKDYMLNQMPELLEFVAYPTTSDSILHELLPRLSWNKSLRQYHNTRQFIIDYNLAENEKRKEILKSVQSSILFNDQQNNDVNVWLYRNHEEFVKSEGLSFDLLR